MRSRNRHGHPTGIALAAGLGSARLAALGMALGMAIAPAQSQSPTAIAIAPEPAEARPADQAGAGSQPDPGATPAPVAEETAATSGDADALPPRPGDRVYDGSRVFSPEERRELGQLLADLEQARGISMFVAVHGFLLGESVDARAARLKDAWVGDDQGVVVVYVRGSEQLTFATTEDMDAFLARSDLVDIFTGAAGAAREAATGERPHAARVIAACSTVVQGLGEKIDRVQATRDAFNRRRALMISGFVVLLVALALAGIALGRLRQRLEERSTRFYYFPRVDVAPRFGAGHCGGAMAQIDAAELRTREEPTPDPTPVPDRVHAGAGAGAPTSPQAGA